MRLKNLKLADFLFYLTLFSLPLYLVRFSMFSVPTNILEILALLSIIFFVFNNKNKDSLNIKPRLKSINFGIILLFSGLFLSFLANDWTLSGLGIIKGWFILPFIFSVILFHFLDCEQKIAKSLRALYLSIFLVALISLIYQLLGIKTFDNRLSAFYESPNQLAMFLSSGFFLAIYLASQEKRTFMRKLLYFTLSLIITAFYLTLSYASWIAVGFALIFIFLLQKQFEKKTYIILAAPIIMLSLFFISQYNNTKLINLNDTRSSISSRLMIWHSSWQIAKDNAYLGIGPGNFQKTYLEYQKYYPPYLEWAVPQPHNIYLAFYLQTGPLGLVGFMLICYGWLKIAFKQKNTAFSTVSLGILLFILLNGFFDTPYWKNDFAYIFWIFLSIAIAFAKLANKSLKVQPINPSV